MQISNPLVSGGEDLVLNLKLEITGVHHARYDSLDTMLGSGMEMGGENGSFELNARRLHDESDIL